MLLKTETTLRTDNKALTDSFQQAIALRNVDLSISLKRAQRERSWLSRTAPG